MFHDIPIGEAKTGGLAFREGRHHSYPLVLLKLRFSIKFFSLLCDLVYNPRSVCQGLGRGMPEAGR